MARTAGGRDVVLAGGVVDTFDGAAAGSGGGAVCALGTGALDERALVPGGAFEGRVLALGGPGAFEGRTLARGALAEPGAEGGRALGGAGGKVRS
jgi:hypothetical protein